MSAEGVIPGMHDSADLASFALKALLDSHDGQEAAALVETAGQFVRSVSGDTVRLHVETELGSLAADCPPAITDDALSVLAGWVAVGMSTGGRLYSARRSDGTTEIRRWWLGNGTAIQPNSPVEVGEGQWFVTRDQDEALARFCESLASLG